MRPYSSIAIVRVQRCAATVTVAVCERRNSHQIASAIAASAINTYGQILCLRGGGAGFRARSSALFTSAEPSIGAPHCVQWFAFAAIGAPHAGQVRSAPTNAWPATRVC
jgi:hypothetical protein